MGRQHCVVTLRFARIPVCGVNQNLAWGKVKIRFCGGGGNEQKGIQFTTNTDFTLEDAKSNVLTMPN